MDEMNDFLHTYLAKKKEESKGYCPGRDEWTAYCNGSLDKRTEERLQDHLAVCDVCLDQVVSLKSGTQPHAWEKFEEDWHGKELYEPKQLVLYINGRRFGEYDVLDTGRSDIMLETAEVIDNIEIRNDKGHILDYIDPALCRGKKIDAIIHLTDDRQLRTVIKFKKDRTYLRVRYKDESKPAQLLKILREGFKHPYLVTVFTSFSLILVAVTYFIARERQRMGAATHRHQAVISSYENKIKALQEENEQLRKPRYAEQSEIVQLRQELIQPQLATSRFEEIPLVLKSGTQWTEPKALEFTEKIRSIALAFSFYIQDYKSYQVEIYARNGKTLLWKSPEQPVAPLDPDTPLAMFSLTLKAGFLSEGDYHLRIYGTNRQRQLIAEYPFRIRSSSFPNPPR